MTYGAVVPLPPDEAFDFVSDPANWPSFIESMESAERLEGWGTPGGRARMVTRVSGRRLTTELELVEWERPTRFRYIGHNESRADMDNSRVFEAVPEGTRLTGTTTAHARPGLAMLVDLVAAVALRRMLHRAMKELPTQALKWKQSRGMINP